jgi:hypothetical protein
VFRREVDRSRWVVGAPCLVYHTLLHPACRPSLSPSTMYWDGRCISQGASVCQLTSLDHARRERYVGCGTFRVPDGKPQPKASQSRPPRSFTPTSSLTSCAISRHQTTYMNMSSLLIRKNSQLSPGQFALNLLSLGKTILQRYTQFNMSSIQMWQILASGDNHISIFCLHSMRMLG